MPTEDDERRTKFLIAEYRESANAYFEGANIGWTGLRFFITINATFAAAFAVLAGLKEQPSIPGQSIADHIVKFNPLVALSFALAAIVLCVVIILVRKHYYDHLENCRLRCEQLEAEWGGQLFTRMGHIGNDGFNSTPVVNIIVICIAVFWAIAAYMLFLPIKP